MGRQGPLGSKRRVAEGGTEPEEEEEYEVEEVRDHIASSRGSRLALFGSDLRLGRFRPRRRSRRRPLAGEGAVEGFFHDLVIHPDNKYVINSPVPAISLICVRSFRFRFRARAGCCCFWNLTAATRRARSVGVLRSDGSRESPELIDHDHKNPIFYFFINKNFILCIYYVSADNYG